jgi:predicted dithiol-disulfide oxidoreductase (DUF899 family)
MAKIVSREEWLAARQQLLAAEKELTRARDDVSRRRRELPWVKVEKRYEFQSPKGKETLSDLFEGRSQLLLYHFMFGPDWNEGCPSCSFWADNYDGTIVHLNHRDVTFVVVSRAPLEKLEAYRRRMGWRFKWVSSFGGDFNYDFRVSFTPEEMKRGEMEYNYRMNKFPSDEAPGISVFSRDDDGSVFHTYSCYSRGLDMLNAAYHHLDLVPKGRDEDGLAYSMAWLRRHDSYD